MDESGWDDFAKRLLRAEMVKAGVGSAELAARMTALGMKETEHTVKAKIGRGSFRGSFLIVAFKALGRDLIRLD